MFSLTSMSRAFLAMTAALCLSAPVLGQSIEVGQLGSAQAYEVGTLNTGNGGFDQSLWQGTSAARAVALMQDAPTNTSHPIAKRLVRAALLSSGVPPQATNAAEASAFRRARLAAIIALGDMQAAQAITSRTPDLSGDNKISSDLALLAGDTQSACAIADTVLENRGSPEWAHLRAFCHVLRGETPAAELTADILRNTGYDDPVFFSLLRVLSGGTGKPDLKTLTHDPLYAAMLSKASIEWPGPGRAPASVLARTALNSLAQPETRLNALYGAGYALSDNQTALVLKALSLNTEDELAGSSFVDLAGALDAPVPLGTGHLYKLAVDGPQADRPKAIAALLSRADGAGAFERFASLLTPQIQQLSPEEQVLTDLPRFTQAAILRGDVALLQRFYALLNDRPKVQARIALAADALGYGFAGGGLGLDIETRLTEKGKGLERARRDAFLALAMGAKASDMIEPAIAASGLGKGKAASAGDLILLKSAARSGARAETALRVAAILNAGRPDDMTLYAVIEAMDTAGLAAFSGQIAALDFWADMGE